MSSSRAGSRCIASLVLWAIIFEIVLPRLGPFRGLAVADPVDVLYYAAGALVGAAW